MATLHCTNSLATWDKSVTAEHTSQRQDSQVKTILLEKILGGRDETFLDQRDDQIHKLPGRVFGSLH